MMKKRKFGTGGMPSIEESVKSGNRVSKQVGAETKKLMPPKKRTMPPIGESVKSGNRMSGENAKDLKAVKKYAKGGKVKPINIDMKGLEEASRSKASLPKADLESKVPEKKRSFRDAFAAARKDMLKGGPKTFTWMGKSYGTQLAGEKPKAKPVDKPKANSGDKPKVNSGVNAYSTKTPLSDIKRSLDMNNSQMSNAQLQNFIAGLNRDAENSAADKLGNIGGRIANATGTSVKHRLVEPKYAKGGAVTRGDGIAKKGKTKGKMV